MLTCLGVGAKGLVGGGDGRFTGALGALLDVKEEVLLGELFSLAETGRLGEAGLGEDCFTVLLGTRGLRGEVGCLGTSGVLLSIFFLGTDSPFVAFWDAFFTERINFPVCDWVFGVVSLFPPWFRCKRIFFASSSLIELLWLFAAIESL